MKAYYDRRAPEYDHVWHRTGRYAARPDRARWHEQVVQLLGVVASLPAARTLDVACGTGFLTRHLHGEVTGLDQSSSMLELARTQAPNASFLQGDALALPFADGTFDRVFTSFFYGHLEPDDRERFLAEARRVGRELVVVEPTQPPRPATRGVGRARARRRLQLAGVQALLRRRRPRRRAGGRGCPRGQPRRGRARMTDAAAVTAWIERYRVAWESNDPADIEALFTEDAAYRTEPYEEPWRGREAIVAGWLDKRDEPGVTTFRYEVAAVCDDLAFVEDWTHYSTEPQRTYSNLWVLRLAEDGRAHEFTEWWMKHPSPGA